MNTKCRDNQRMKLLGYMKYFNVICFIQGPFAEVVNIQNR